MRMLMIIMKESLEEEVREVLRNHNVGAFTEMHEVVGQGEAGATLHSLSWPGFNDLILAAMPEPEANQVIDALAEFRERTMQKQQGAKVPLRVFSLPCELVV
jgi:nitrogen regulatory protein PII